MLNNLPPTLKVSYRKLNQYWDRIIRLLTAQWFFLRVDINGEKVTLLAELENP